MLLLVSADFWRLPEAPGSYGFWGLLAASELLEASPEGWRQAGGRLEAGRRQAGSRLEAGWRQAGGRLEAGWRQIDM